MKSLDQGFKSEGFSFREKKKSFEWNSGWEEPALAPDSIEATASWNGICLKHNQSGVIQLCNRKDKSPLCRQLPLRRAPLRFGELVDSTIGLLDSRSVSSPHIKTLYLWATLSYILYLFHFLRSLSSGLNLLRCPPANRYINTVCKPSWLVVKTLCYFW